MYTKTTWIARVGTALNRFLKTNESSASVELTADPTGVSTPGTPFTVENMNKIEQGIYDAHVVLDNNINQNVKTTASPTFASVNTGHGSNELYPMNQAVRTTDNVEYKNGYFSEDVEVGGNIFPTTLPTSGSQMILEEATWTPPRGVYVWSSNGEGIKISIDGGSTFEIGDGNASGTFFADGSKVRLYNRTGDRTISYLKF